MGIRRVLLPVETGIHSTMESEQLRRQPICASVINRNNSGLTFKAKPGRPIGYGLHNRVGKQWEIGGRTRTHWTNGSDVP